MGKIGAVKQPRAVCVFSRGRKCSFWLGRTNHQEEIGDGENDYEHNQKNKPAESRIGEGVPVCPA